MPAFAFYIGASFVNQHGNEVTAAGTVIVAVAVAKVVDTAIARRGRRLRETVARGELSPVLSTRLRLLRRLIFAAVILFGVVLALAQFPSVKRVAAGVLASSAVLALVFGFAARQTLANAIAGLFLAITQPIRIGDLVTFEGQTGEVEDLRLTYTYIRLDDGGRLVVPNERLAQSPVVNQTVFDPRVEVEASVWVPSDTDVDRALELIADGAVEANIAEADKEGLRLTATTWVSSAREREAAAAGLRLRWLRELRDQGLVSDSRS